MKLRYQILLVVIAAITLSLVGAVVAPPPADADLTFKVGWYFGHVAGWVENLFR